MSVAIQQHILFASNDEHQAEEREKKTLESPQSLLTDFTCHERIPGIAKKTKEFKRSVDLAAGKKN